MSVAVTFNAEIRQDMGSLFAKKLRRSNKIPAIIYGKDAKSTNVNISVDTKEFEQEYFKGNLQATIVNLVVDGKNHQVIAHKIELDPVTDRPIHIDFFSCDQDEFKAQPKITFTNRDKSPGLKRGGFLNIVKRKLNVICKKGAVIPVEIFYDISALKVGQKVRASDLSLPEGVSLAIKSDVLIASITGRVSKEDNAEANNPEAKAVKK